MQLWSEGYKATGDDNTATFHGNFECNSLEEAITLFRDSLPSNSEKSLVNIKEMTFWGCRFYDNEIDARKSFG